MAARLLRPRGAGGSISAGKRGWTGRKPRGDSTQVHILPGKATISDTGSLDITVFICFL